MRTATRTLASGIAAPLLLLFLSPAWGQPLPAVPKPPTPPAAPTLVVEDLLIKIKPGTLEQMLAEALKNNPDVRVAESKLREAEAQLNRARMQVMQKAVTLRGALDAQEGAVKEAEAAFKAAESNAKRFAELRKKNFIEEAQVDEAIAGLESARQKLLAAKTRSAELEGEVNFLVGKNRMRFTVMLHDVKATEMPMRLWRQDKTGGVYTEALGPMEVHWVVQAAPGSTADKVRKALDKPVRVDIKDKYLADVLKDFQKAHGINFVVADKKLGDTVVTIQTEEMPLGAVLEMLEDMAGVRFAVRDYGVLATAAHPLPAGAVPLHTFWKAAKAPAAAKPKESKLQIEIKP